LISYALFVRTSLLRVIGFWLAVGSILGGTTVGLLVLLGIREPARWADTLWYIAVIPIGLTVFSAAGAAKSGCTSTEPDRFQLWFGFYGLMLRWVVASLPLLLAAFLIR
jgi:hypothetical protein